LLIAERTAQILRELHAKLIVRMAVADKEPHWSPVLHANTRFLHWRDDIRD
jgi:hypothetical protein